MLSFTSAFSVYSKVTTAARALKAAGSIGHWASEALKLTSSELEDLHPDVRCRLQILSRRVTVIAKPLNYLLLWSQQYGSAVAETVHQCKGALRQVYAFLAQCSKNKTLLTNSEQMVPVLDQHIRELEFSVSSLTLAMQIVQSSSLPQHSALSTPPEEEKTDSAARAARPISASSLLRASKRIGIMHGKDGDVCDAYGKLYQMSASRSSSGTAAPVWKLLYQKAQLKVYRNLTQGVYELRVDAMAMVDGSRVSRSPKSLCWTLSGSLNIRTVCSASLPLTTSKPQHVDQLPEDGFTWVEKFSNQLRAKYAFVFRRNTDDWDSDAPPSDPDGQQAPPLRVDLLGVEQVSQGAMLSETPQSLDCILSQADSTTNIQQISYIMRLASYENEQSSAQPRRAVSTESKPGLRVETQPTPMTPPAHLDARDEELELILANPAPDRSPVIQIQLSDIVDQNPPLKPDVQVDNFTECGTGPTISPTKEGWSDDWGTVT